MFVTGLRSATKASIQGLMERCGGVRTTVHDRHVSPTPTRQSTSILHSSMAHQIYRRNRFQDPATSPAMAKSCCLWGPSFVATSGRSAHHYAVRHRCLCRPSMPEMAARPENMDADGRFAHARAYEFDSARTACRIRLHVSLSSNGVALPEEILPTPWASSASPESERLNSQRLSRNNRTMEHLPLRDPHDSRDLATRPGLAAGRYGTAVAAARCAGLCLRFLRRRTVGEELHLGTLRVGSRRVSLDRL